MWHRSQQSATVGTRQYLAGCLLGGMRCTNTSTTGTGGGCAPLGGGSGAARWASSVGGGSSSSSSSASSVPSTTAFGFKDFTASASSYGASDAAKASQQRKAETSPDALAALLSNPATARKVVLGLSESARRRLTMMASRQEWEMDHTNDTPPQQPSTTPKSTTSSTTTNTPPFNTSGASLSGSRQTLKSAERVRGSGGGCGKGGSREDEELTMNNGDVTAIEHREWARQAVSRRATGGTGSSRDINWRVLLKIGLQTACPFVAFGMLDNSLLVLSGDLIDSLLGERLDLSGMGAAAMGGIVSGTMGIQMHGLADRLVQKYGPSRPRLTPQEWRMSKTKRTIHWCGTLGLILGLSLGMFPLYFID